MDVRAAVAREPNARLSIETVTLDGPRAGECLVQVAASGVCHTDELARSGLDGKGLFPIILGHERQCVPHTVWHKKDPAIWPVLRDHPIQTHILERGDVYLLRAESTLHRVYPLLSDSRRLIVNMAWASAADLRRPTSHETVETLWSAPARDGGAG